MRVARTAAQLRSCLRHLRYSPSSCSSLTSTNAAYYCTGLRASCRGLATLPDNTTEPMANAISAPVKKLLDPVNAPENVVAAAPVAAKIADDAFSSSQTSANASTTTFSATGESFVNAAEPVTAYTTGTGTSATDVAGAAVSAIDGASNVDPTAATQVAEAATMVDPAAAAQAAEAAATAGFSLSDTLLQPTIMLLHGIHNYSGLPWWLSIGLATFAVRTAIMPLTIMTVRNSAKMAALQPELAVRREAVMEAMRSGDQSKAMKRQESMKTFLRDAGVGPSKVLLGPLAQFPIFISFFVGVRRLAVSEPSMTTGGAAWFADLSVADPTFVLPICCGLSLAAMTELGGDTGTTKITPTMKKGLRIMAVLSVPLTYWFPAGVFCYWLPNNLYSVIFSSAIRTEAMKKRIGMNVDLSKIPGTKEYARVNKQFKFNTPLNAEKVSAAKAAASYVKKIDNESVSIPEIVNVDEKPVLLRQRPKKKKKVSSHG